MSNLFEGLFQRAWENTLMRLGLILIAAGAFSACTLNTSPKHEETIANDYYGAAVAQAPTATNSNFYATVSAPASFPTLEATNQPAQDGLYQDPIYGLVTQSEATCVRNTFEALKVSGGPVNKAAAGGADGSPSATLGLWGVIQQGSFVSEFDHDYGRKLTVRGGESGQITATNPLTVVFVILSQNVLNFTQYYTKPEQGIVVAGGVPLASVGLEINEGMGQVEEDLLNNAGVVGYVSGPVKIMANVGSVFNGYTMNTGSNPAFTDFSSDNLRGIAVATSLLPGSCWAIKLSVTVPENQILTFGAGTFQYPHYSAIGDFPGGGAR